MPAPFHTTFDYFATARGRIGYAFGALMPYVTGGVAWGRTKLNLNDADGDLISSATRTHFGWTAGAGVEFAVGGNWTAKAEYAYLDLMRQTYDLGNAGLPNASVDPNIHTVKVGLNYRLWDTPPWLPSAPIVGKTVLPESADWNVHAQTTFIASAYPRIRSPYEGTNSLPGGGQGRETFLQRQRSWAGDCGRAVSSISIPSWRRASASTHTLGLAGFPNGEAQKRAARRFRAFACSAITSARRAWPRRRTGRRPRRCQSIGRQARYRPHHAHGRTLRGWVIS